MFANCWAIRSAIGKATRWWSTPPTSRTRRASAASSENLHVIERFTRIVRTQILYRATIDDPSTFTKQWTMEFPFRATPGPIYEYACHEGNYAMTDIMGGARKMESQKK